MASKVLVVSVVLLFSIAVVGVIPKYGLRSENQDDVNCTDLLYQLWHHNICRLYQDFQHDDYVVILAEDLYQQINQRLTAFCGSQCKNVLVAYDKSCSFDNDTSFGTFTNNFTCGKINQEYCYIHYLRGVTAGRIVTLNTLWYVCPENRNMYTLKSSCTKGACQRYMTQYAGYMSCCAGPLLDKYFNLTSCGITDTTSTPCSSETSTVTISSSVFIMIAIAIIQMY